MVLKDATILNLYTDKRKDKETGEVTETPKMQVLAALPVNDGDEVKMDMHEVKVDRMPDGLMKPLVGKKFDLPVGVYALDKNKWGLWLQQETFLEQLHQLKKAA